MQQQRDIANAVKNAREMALLPYTKRVSQTRAGRPPRDGDEDGGGRGGRDGGGEVVATRQGRRCVPSRSTQVDDAAVEADDDETVEA